MGDEKMRRIDKICKQFLWQGAQEQRHGHCLVNWKQVQQPKKLGGLAILDLERFNRALRLRWQWSKWTNDQKPWSKLKLHHSDTEMAPFRACTSMTVGNGEKANFWHDCWLNGQAPVEIALELLRFAWRKNLTVKQALNNRNWFRGFGLWCSRCCYQSSMMKSVGGSQRVESTHQNQPIPFSLQEASQTTTGC
jgi:hypothetical protein